MSHCWYHSLSSVRRFGGIPQDYLHIHEWFDQGKAAWNFPTHRALLHNEFGIRLALDIWGHSFIRQSDGKAVELEPVINLHLQEDLGRIPTLADWLRDLKISVKLQTIVVEPDLQPLLDFFLAPRAMWDDPRALVVTVNTVGIYLCEQRFGQLYERTGRVPTPTRVLAEALIQRACGGRIPTVQDWLQTLSLAPKWRRDAAVKLSEEFGDGYGRAGARGGVASHRRNNNEAAAFNQSADSTMIDQVEKRRNHNKTATFNRRRPEEQEVARGKDARVCCDGAGVRVQR